MLITNPTLRQMRRQGTAETSASRL